MTQPINVLKCILDSRFGGPHRRSYAMARHLRPEGVQTTFLFGDKGDAKIREPEFEHLYRTHLQFARRRHAITNLLGFLWHLAGNVGYIRKVIRSRHIDVVDVDGITNVVPALAAHLERVPIVWYYNEPHVPESIKRLVLPLVAALSSTVVVQGEKLKEERTGSRAKLHQKTVVLYPGIDSARFDAANYSPQARRAMREELGCPGEGPLVGMIGNHRWKGHAYFVEAAKRIKERVPTARFTIIGEQLDSEAELWKHLIERTKQLGLADAMVYAGFREDVPKVLSALDVFVLSSVWESCPNVVLEAMAMKVPVVATDVGAVSELVTDSQTGLVVPARDADAIAQAVLDYLDGPPERARAITEAARRRIEEMFAADRIAAQQKRIYQTVCRRRPPEESVRDTCS